ncbi:MAG: hypothetical protein ACLUEQ_08370 [Cloacibacillus evryensis]
MFTTPSSGAARFFLIIVMPYAAKDGIQGAEFIAICVPIYMGAEVIGTLNAVMGLRDAAAFLKNINIQYNGAFLFLVDGENSVISNSGLFSDPQMFLSSSTNVFNFMGGILSERESDELAARMSSAADGSDVCNYSSKDTGRFISYVTLPNTNAGSSSPSRQTTVSEANSASC